MSTATLPKSLRTRLTSLGQRLHYQRVLRHSCRIILVMTGIVLGTMLVDSLLGLPIVVRCAVLIGWVALGVVEIRRFFREVLTAPIDAEGVACAIEQEYPRLAERLSTAVELAGTDDPANGSPELIADVVAEAEVRTRKLDLQRASDSRRTRWFAFAASSALVTSLFLLSFAPGSVDSLRRFFVPFYNPSTAPVELGYRVVVTSGDPTLKRGEMTDLAGYIEITRPGVTGPTSAFVILKTINGTQQRLPMEFDPEKGVVHRTYGPAEAGFEYCIESGAAVSEWHKVAVIEPIRLEEITVTVTLPAYATRHADAPIRFQGLGEINALQHSTITWDIKFSRVPSSVWVEWKPNVEADKVPTTERIPLPVDGVGRAHHRLQAVVGGEMRLMIDLGKNGMNFPAQLIRVIPDAPPRFVKVDGVFSETRMLRPDAKLPIELAIQDDITVAKVELEYRLNQGPSTTLNLPLRGVGTTRVSDAYELNVADKAKENDLFEFRLIATDNRNLPEANLTPQQVYFPADGKWASIRFNKDAIPLKEQDILAKKKLIDDRLQKMIRELEAEQRSTYTTKVDTARKPKLTPDESNKLEEVSKQVRDTHESLDELARETGLTPELEELAGLTRDVADHEIRDADNALNQARKDDAALARTRNLDKADNAIAESIRRLEQLRKINERTAQARLDRERLEQLLHEQQQLLDRLEQAKNNPEELARIQEQIKKLAQDLQKLAQESELAKQAIQDANRQQIDELLKKSQDIEKEQLDLNAAIERAKQTGEEKKLDELMKKQKALNQKAEELAKKTSAASRVGKVDPLKPENADNAVDLLKKGDFQNALEQQEKSAFELNRLAKELERSMLQTKDPQAAAEQLQRLQRDVKQRLEEATKDTPLKELKPEERKQLEQEQAIIRKSVEKLSVPPEAAPAKQRVAEAAKTAEKALADGDQADAEARMDATAKALEKLAEQLPTREKRLAKARAEVEKLKQEQESIAKQADAAVAGLGKKDPDARETQRELSGKLADAAGKQAETAGKLAKLDTPGLEERRLRVQETLRKAQNDLTDGKPQDIAASQQAAKRELDRLEQALGGKEPVDEAVDRLAKKQRDVADQLAKNAKNPDPMKTKELLQKQGEIQRELDKLQAKELPGAQDEAQRLSRKTEYALRENDLKKAAEQAEQTAQRLQHLADQLNHRQSEKETVDQLVKKQKKDKVESELTKKDPMVTDELRKKAQRAQEELKNLRPGEDGQAAKQKAMDALRDVQSAKTPEELAQAEKQAEEALQDLADRLTRKMPMDEPQDAQSLTRSLADKQRQLQRETQEAIDQAKKQGGEAEKKATADALQKAAEKQRELSKEASEIPTTDTPQALRQAKAAMNQAEQAAAKKDAAETVKKQAEAAEALDRLAKQVAEQAAKQPEPMDAASDSLPNKLQAEEARRLAEEQQQLRQELKQTLEDIAKAERGEQKENPLADLNKEQADIADKAAQIAEGTKQQQGEKGEATQKATAAASGAKRASEQLKNGEIDPARKSGEQTAGDLRELAKSIPDGKLGKQATDLAERQEALTKKLEAANGNQGRGAMAQQAQRQDEIEREVDQLQQQLDKLSKEIKRGEGSAAGGKMEQAVSNLRQAQQALKNARQQSKEGKREPARLSRADASRAMELARQQLGESAKEMAQQPGKPNDAKTGESLLKARDQMEKAQQELGKGQPDAAGKSMQQAAQSLKQASQQIGRSGQGPQSPTAPNPNQPKYVSPPAASPDLTPFQKILEKYPGKAWGELPGKVQTEVIQEMSSRYGEEYARNIKLYFEQLAERK